MSDLIEFDIQSDRSSIGAFAESTTDFEAGVISPMQPRGGPIGTAHFLEPVSLIAATTLSVLAYRIVEHWLTSRENGVQIDARTTPPTISNIAGIPAGFVVLIAPDGSVTTQSSNVLSSQGLAALLGKVIGS